jgi:putative ABC transport system substrate-binding protein
LRILYGRHRAAGLVDKSLTGAKPADIPVERLIKLELLINLKSAKILGPKIPEKLLALASEAIE